MPPSIRYLKYIIYEEIFIKIKSDIYISLIRCKSVTQSP